MDFNQFRKELEEKMIEKTKDMPGSIQFQMVQKNGGPKHGIIFTPEGSSVGMTMYAEDGFKHYQEGNSIDKIAEDMAASMVLDSELRETQTANYFSAFQIIDRAVWKLMAD
nr:DUF5688 family protein [uncultured Blautia sp.]